MPDSVHFFLFCNNSNNKALEQHCSHTCRHTFCVPWGLKRIRHRGRSGWSTLEYFPWESFHNLSTIIHWNSQADYYTVINVQHCSPHPTWFHMGLTPAGAADVDTLQDTSPVVVKHWLATHGNIIIHAWPLRFLAFHCQAVTRVCVMDICVVHVLACVFWNQHCPFT